MFKDGKKLLQKMMKGDDEQAKKVNQEVSVFYPNGELVKEIAEPEDGSNSVDPFAEVASKSRENPNPKALTEDELQERCNKIRDYVKQGKPDNMVISLVLGELRTQGKSYELKHSVIKAIAFDTDETVYLRFKPGDVVSGLIYIGGDDMDAILVSADEEGKLTFLRFSEFHMLCVFPNPEIKKEFGLIISFLWLTAKVYFDFIRGANLDPIKNLILSDALRDQIAEQQKPKEIEGDDTNE